MEDATAAALDRLDPRDRALADKAVAPPAPPRDRPDRTTLDAKAALLAQEFAGRPLLHLLHAWLIVRLRREAGTEAARQRFLLLWDAHRDALLAGLNSRWLVSACDTFADHHPDPMTRAAALAVSAAITTLRLGETERQASGEEGRPILHGGECLPLHDGLLTFAVGRGDTLINLQHRIGRSARDGTVPGRILAELWRRAQAADTVFRRMADAHHLDATRWTSRSPPRLRVALFNDTAPSGHYGCEAVTAVIERLFDGAGIAIGWRHSVLTDPLADPGTAPAIAAADAVVVNGEGSIHHRSPRGRALARLGPLARAAGKPAWLINATLQDTDAATVEDLRAFTAIWVRESASAAWARSQGLRVTVAPDLSLCHWLRARPTRGRRGGTALVDSVLDPCNRTLLGWAQTLGEVLWTMKHDAEGRAQHIRPGARPDAPLRILPRGAPRDLAAFAVLLGGFDRLLTGRFHAMCLALLLRLPFHALASNTWKIEATIADAGLDPVRHVAPGGPPPAPLPFSAHETDAIARYIRRARIEAGEMVLRILSGR
jgi:hypothetical protein